MGEAGELPKTLDSVKAALGEAAEIIVADGGSRDGTAEIARGRARLLESAPGRGRQLNAGARAARGDVLLFLHADTWLSPGTDAAITRALARAEVVGGCFKITIRGPSARRSIARALAAAINARTRLFRTATGDQAIFCRRSAFEAAGGFPNRDLFEDVMFYRRLRRLGAVALLEPAVRTSDRRWRERGYVRTIVTRLVLRLLFVLGVSSESLARVDRRG